MIQLELDKTKLEDKDYITEVVNTILLRRIVEGENQRLKKCFDFYDGKEPLVKFDEKVDYEPKVINLTKPIVDIATQTFIGELPDIVTSGKKDEKKKISVFSQKLYNAGFPSAMFETCHYGSKSGSGYLSLYTKVGDTFPRFRELNPRFAECVYDCSLQGEHLLSYNVFTSSEGDGDLATAKYYLYVYTKKHIFAFKGSGAINMQTTKADPIKSSFFTDYTAWTMGDVSVSVVEHGFSDIPIVEFPNNAEYKGDAECVFDLISLYNEVQNNRCKNLHDVVNYILMLKNVDLGNKEEQDKVVLMLKENHILPVKGEDVDAKFLSNPLNQEQLQVLANNIKDLIHLISRVPDLSGTDFSQNASDPILKIKTKPLLDLCSDKEKKCTEPYRKVLSLILNWCEDHSSDYQEFNFDLSKTRLKYAHNLPSNDGDMITMITNLANSGMANPEVLLQQLSFIDSVSDYMKGMDKWNEEVDKRKSLQQNNEKGLNANNLEKQNAKPLTKDNMDNKRNFDRGNADTISDLK